MIKIAVGDIMTRNFISIDVNASITDCARQFVKHNVNSLLVVNKEKLIGIITVKDILKSLAKRVKIPFKKIRAADIAARKVAVISPASEINQALDKMKNLGFKRLPVISNGNVLGIITLKDILRIDPTLYSESGELIKIKEEEEKLKKSKLNWPLEGFCEECGAFSELLKVGNKALCIDCRADLSDI